MRTISLTPHTSIPKEAKKSVIVLGNFDGVHLGHQHLIKHAHHIAHTSNAPLSVLTFDPHPAVILGQGNRHSSLSIFSQKEHWLAAADIDFLFVIPFNTPFSQLPASDFVHDYLYQQLAVLHIVIGHDFIFGHNRTGNAALLRQLSEGYAFSLTQVDAYTIQKDICSSTRIRQAIQKGDLSLARLLLGRPFTLAGNIQKGMQRGRSIGFPTANLIPTTYTLPPAGVYAVNIQIEGVTYPAIANLGIRPTFSDSEDLLLEVHIFNFNQLIYDQYVEVEMIAFIREEQSFSSATALKEQIIKDCSIAKEMLTN